MSTIKLPKYQVGCIKARLQVGVYKRNNKHLQCNFNHYPNFNINVRYY